MTKGVFLNKEQRNLPDGRHRAIEWIIALRSGGHYNEKREKVLEGKF